MQELRQRQTARVGALIDEIVGRNPFYTRKLAGIDACSAVLASLPLTSKDELVEDQASHPPYGTDLTFPLERYTRLHLTSGTTGRPLRWLDTAESWDLMVGLWQRIYEMAGVGTGDRVFVAASFGPFIGFWLAFEAAQRIGCLVIPGGGMSSEQRLRSILAHDVTVLTCTPTYALRLAQVAREHGLDLPSSAMRICIHGGEPGASLPNVRRRIEEAWGARVFDHAGATEVGPWGAACGVETHMHVFEDEFVPEVVDDAGSFVAPDGDGLRRGELVLTNLGRAGSPLIRYRTGDLVALSESRCPCGAESRFVAGGVLARRDGMIVVRGVNIYPSAIANLIAEFPEISEYRVTVEPDREMRELGLEIETDSGDAVAGRLAAGIRERLHVRARVETVPPGTLPRQETKARRIRFRA